MITGKENIYEAGLILLRKQLLFEIKSGLKSKGTLLTCKKIGFQGRTRKQALEWLDLMAPHIKKHNEIPHQ